MLYFQYWNIAIQSNVALKLNDSKISLFYPENETKRSQDFENSYHDSGQFYFLKTDRFLKNRTVFTKNTGSILLYGVRSSGY